MGVGGPGGGVGDGVGAGVGLPPQLAVEYVPLQVKGSMPRAVPAHCVPVVPSCREGEVRSGLEGSNDIPGSAQLCCTSRTSPMLPGMPVVVGVEVVRWWWCWWCCIPHSWCRGSDTGRSRRRGSSWGRSSSQGLCQCARAQAR